MPITFKHIRTSLRRQYHHHYNHYRRHHPHDLNGHEEQNEGRPEDHDDYVLDDGVTTSISTTASSSSTLSTTKEEAAVPSYSFAELCYRLETNDPNLTTLKIGWIDSDYLMERRQIKELQHALEKNYTITSVSIGWRHRDRKTLWDFLLILSHLSHKKFTARKKRLHLLKRMELVLDDWVPESILKQLFSSHKYLQHIYIRSTHVCYSPTSSSGNFVNSVRSTTSTDIVDSASTTRSEQLQQQQQHQQGSSNNKRQNINHFIKKKLRKRIKPTVSIHGNNKMPMGSSASPNHSDRSIVKILQDCLVEHEQLKCLSLADCDVTDQNAHFLANFIKERGGIKELSLRHNRQLGPRGLRKICQAPVFGSLDFSLCNLDDDGAMAIAEAFCRRRNNTIKELQKSASKKKKISWVRVSSSSSLSSSKNNSANHNSEKTPATTTTSSNGGTTNSSKMSTPCLGELILCGNYQFTNRGLVALSKYCTSCVKHLDLSYCDLSDGQLKEMLQELSRQKNNTVSCLEHLTLRGARVQSTEAIEALTELIRQNDTLKTIRINYPSNPRPIPERHLAQILESVKDNYVLEELEMDNYDDYSKHMNNTNNGTATPQVDNNNNNHNNEELIGSSSNSTSREFLLRQELDFNLRLNRAGRRILRSNIYSPISSDNSSSGSSNGSSSANHYTQADWVEVLSKASGQLDILYWLLQNNQQWALD